VAERPTRLDPGAESRFWSGVEYASRFFMGEGEVQQALLKLTRLLEDAGIPYAVIGAMALNEYGYRRVTVDVDILLTRAGLDALKARALGRGYREKFPGSRGLRDAEHGVPIDVVLAGEYPGEAGRRPSASPTRPRPPSAAPGSPCSRSPRWSSSSWRPA
jgi:hypothetical protein